MGRHPLEFDDHYMILPEIYSHNAAKLEKFLKNRKGKTLDENFSYTSSNNTEWLSIAEIQNFIENNP